VIIGFISCFDEYTRQDYTQPLYAYIDDFIDYMNTSLNMSHK